MPLETRLFSYKRVNDFGRFDSLFEQHTPSRYLSCPKRSRYLLQKGIVPKFFVILLRRLLADDIRNATLGASAFFA